MSSPLKLATFNMLVTPNLDPDFDQARARTGAVALQCFQMKPDDAAVEIAHPFRRFADQGVKIWVKPWKERETAVLDRVGALIADHDVVCLQEVTPEWASSIANRLKETKYKIFYNPGGRHGTAIIYDVTRCPNARERSYQHSWRKMSGIDFVDPGTHKFVRIVSAHLLAYENLQTELSLIRTLEKGTTWERALQAIANLVRRIFGWQIRIIPEVVSVGADFNSSLTARRKSADQACYLDPPQHAGLFVADQPDAFGLYGRKPKPRDLGVCAFRVHGARAKTFQIDPCDPKKSLSDHASVSITVDLT